VKFNIVNNSNQNFIKIKPLLNAFLPFARKKIGFNRPPAIHFSSDKRNAYKLLGKTAHYDPESEIIVIYVDNRHPKDVLRSLSHELVHHMQNCRGDFHKISVGGEQYAQKDPHLRKMEKEAYTLGNMCFRDWEDDFKKKYKDNYQMYVVSEANEPSVMLRRGDGSQRRPNRDVARMQALLVQNDENSLPIYGIDGIFRGETEKWVEKFQNEHDDLDNTGQVGQNTLKKLEQLGDVEKAEQIADSVAASPVGGPIGSKFNGGIDKAPPLAVAAHLASRSRVNPAKIYQDLIQNEVSSELAKAAVANARGESNYRVGAVGDQGCSLGLWQFNICAGLGREMMTYLGVTREQGPDEIYKQITDYNNQIEYISYHITKENPPPRRFKSAKQLVSWFVREVEKPKYKNRAIRERLGFLRELESRGAFQESNFRGDQTLSEWKNKELNRLLLEKFNIGDKDK